MVKEKMITLKQAYFWLTLFDNKLDRILECINEGRPLTAYHTVHDLKKWTADVLKPVYQALPIKAKLQFLDGWDPDTDEGEWLEVDFKGYPKRKEDVK